jgi:hypothetical protein
LHNGPETFEHFSRVEKFADIAQFSGVLGYLNIIDGIVSFVFVGVALLMLVHRLLWPLLCRPLYSVQALGIARRKKLFVVLGVPLLGYGGIHLPSWLQKVFAILAGG